MPVKVAGFTFIRNAIKFDYPIEEAILSILPLCDVVYVAVGKSEDGTRELVKKIDSSKIKIIDTVWDENMREGGRILARETNTAFDAIPDDYDWCFYIQGDEVFNENGIENVRQALESYQNDTTVEGLLFHYRHFYGSYHYIGDSRNWYRREIRIIRNNKRIRSYQDAQGFRLDGRKLNVALISAYIHHYGWVKHPQFQMEKQKQFHRWWHPDNWIQKNVEQLEQYNYEKIDSLVEFRDQHPYVMERRVKNQNWNFHFNSSDRKLTLKEKFSRSIENIFNYRIGEYRNYKIVRKQKLK